MQNIVVLTGAGISAESGLQTFRDGDGLWEGYNIEDVATPRAFKKDPQLVLEFYNMRRKAAAAAQPNTAHYFLAELQHDYNVQIITQNIDDLHERAGSNNVLHLHGEIFKMRSVINEENTYEIKDDIKLGDKAADGAQLRPHIVWFEEQVPLISAAATLVSKADIFIIIGTSLVVYPAAGLLDYAPQACPKFIIDKKMPVIHSVQNLTAIEASASQGVELLREHLKNIK